MLETIITTTKFGEAYKKAVQLENKRTTYIMFVRDYNLSFLSPEASLFNLEFLEQRPLKDIISLCYACKYIIVIKESK